ncbi:hypothetical protein BB560_001792 [Smittium megazygosporum]|uniref:phosphatidate phosphatase n=1 Tax=Smittium megazygosporum TaxID=133381 RepID=A0A2T9ZGK3_9FUNG|nr:hypothetical protein BB560_001792 [Smittium megazygosporum]
MQYVGKMISTVSDFYRDLNPATLSGAIDVIVVRQKSGELKCSPFHVRFGKLQLLRPSDKTVELIVNDTPADFYMKVGDSGEAFFVLETEGEIPMDVQTSPIASPSLASSDFDVPQYYDLSDGAIRMRRVSSGLPQRTNHDSHELIHDFDDTNHARLSSSLDNLNKRFIDDSQINKKTWESLGQINSVNGSTMPVANSNLDIDPFNSILDEDLHHEWDWGVSISKQKTSSDRPTTASVPIDNIAKKDSISASAHSRKHYSVDTRMMSDIFSLTTSDLPSNLKVSLCGSEKLKECKVAEERSSTFESAIVSFDQFMEDPSIVFDNPDTVFLLNGNYYLYNTLSTSLISWFLFKKVPTNLHLSPFIIDNEVQRKFESLHKKDSTDKGLTDHSLDQSNLSEKDTQKSDQSTDNNTSSTLDSQDNNTTTDSPKPSESSWRWWKSSTNSSKLSKEDSSSVLESSEKITGLEPSTTTSETAEPLVSSTPPNGPSVTTPTSHKNYAKTLRLTSSQIESLNLKYGENKVLFRIKSGKAYCEARIFLYNYDSQLVISDIDGTITKSDALGHLFNMVGRDWTHQGVASLFTEISKNQYEFVYLTSRAIGQADTTREYLKNVKQDSFSLPKGPLLLSPDRLFASFRREVIQRRPQEFKMACLKDLKSLFELDTPFYAGFGNRITDAMSYLSVNIPASRICTIDTTGDVKFELLVNYKSTYTKMSDLVDLVFPPLKNKIDSNFNDFYFWKSPIPNLDAQLELELELELAKNTESKGKSKTTPKHKLNKVSTISYLPQTHSEQKPRRAYTMSEKGTQRSSISGKADFESGSGISKMFEVSEKSNPESKNDQSGLAQAQHTDDESLTNAGAHDIQAKTPTRKAPSNFNAVPNSYEIPANSSADYTRSSLSQLNPASNNDSLAAYSKSFDDSVLYRYKFDSPILSSATWVDPTANNNKDNTNGINLENPGAVRNVHFSESFHDPHHYSKKSGLRLSKSASNDGNGPSLHRISSTNSINSDSNNFSTFSRDNSTHFYGKTSKDLGEEDDMFYDDIDSMSSLSDKIDLNDFPYV